MIGRCSMPRGVPVFNNTNDGTELNHRRTPFHQLVPRPGTSAVLISTESSLAANPILRGIIEGACGIQGAGRQVPQRLRSTGIGSIRPSQASIRVRSRYHRPDSIHLRGRLQDDQTTRRTSSEQLHDNRVSATTQGTTSAISSQLVPVSVMTPQLQAECDSGHLHLLGLVLTGLSDRNHRNLDHHLFAMLTLMMSFHHVLTNTSFRCRPIWIRPELSWFIITRTIRL